MSVFEVSLWGPFRKVTQDVFLIFQNLDARFQILFKHVGFMKNDNNDKIKGITDKQAGRPIQDHDCVIQRLLR